MLTLAHKQLHVYQLALEFVQKIYELTRTFPNDEKYSLVSQLRRASVSVCSNLAEGSARFSPAEKKRFYEISRSSIVEIDTQLEIAVALNYLQKETIAELETQLVSLFKMISKMINNLQP